MTEPPAPPPQKMTPLKTLRLCFQLFLFSLAVMALGLVLVPEGTPVPVNVFALDDPAQTGTRFEAFTKFPALIFLVIVGIYFSCRSDSMRGTLNETNRQFFYSVGGLAALLTVAHVVLVFAAL